MARQNANGTISVIIKCKDDPHVLKTIASVDFPAEIIVALVHNPLLQAVIADTGVRVVEAPDDNVGLSCQIGLEAAHHEYCLITDSDTVFTPGYIAACQTALATADLCRGIIRFQKDDAISGSATVAKVRNYFNNVLRQPYMPGLALRRSFATCIGGFDRTIGWGIDHEFGDRALKAGARYRFLPDNNIEHLPISAAHDLKAARRTGRAMKRLECKTGIIRHRLRYRVASALYEPFWTLYRTEGAAACRHHILWVREFHRGYWQD